MLRSFALFFALTCTNTLLCFQNSCGVESGNAAPETTTGCGCENLKRAVALEPVEESTVTVHPAVKYSKEVHDRPPEGQGDEAGGGSQVKLVLFSTFSQHFFLLCVQYGTTEVPMSKK